MTVVKLPLSLLTLSVDEGGRWTCELTDRDYLELLGVTGQKRVIGTGGSAGDAMAALFFQVAALHADTSVP